MIRAGKYRATLVTWLDAVSDGGWKSPEAYKKTSLIKCKSLGFLLSMDKERVILVQQATHDAVTVSDSVTIPRKAVVSIEVLDVEKPKVR